MISNVLVSRFFSVFKGKTSSYVRNELPKVKPEGKKHKTKIITVRETLTKEEIMQHLEGEYAIGICPVSNDNKVHFACIDIDCYTKKRNRVLGIIREYNVPLIPFRSKSGGLHLYIFFVGAVSSKTARILLQKIVYYFSLDEIYGKDKVEIFPKQEKLDLNSCGSCITLPYFNCEDTYTYMIDYDGNKVDIEECLSYCAQHKTSPELIKEILENLPLSDAPPCLQKGVISSLVGGEDSGRNNFLFSFAIYAKKKYGTGFEQYVNEVNKKFDAPLSEEDVEQICNSVSNNEYYYRCKDIPCSSYCDKTVCKTRAYGLGMGGKDKGKFTGIEYGELKRYLTADPYYEWNLRIHGQEAWKKCVFRDENYLLDQKNFQRACVRYLNVAPYTVGNNDWFAILNSVLPNIIEVEVKSESDTSSTNMLKKAFMDYLANKQARRDSPYQIRVGLCVRQEIERGAKYYFTHNGFSEYLRVQKISFDFNMLREMLIKFGAKEDILEYTNANGEQRRFPCWSKVDDEELDEIYRGQKEIEDGDKNSILAIGEIEQDNEIEREEKTYTDEELKKAFDMF